MKKIIIAAGLIVFGLFFSCDTETEPEVTVETYYRVVYGPVREVAFDLVDDFSDPVEMVTAMLAYESGLNIPEDQKIVDVSTQNKAEFERLLKLAGFISKSSECVEEHRDDDLELLFDYIGSQFVYYQIHTVYRLK